MAVGSRRSPCGWSKVSCNGVGMLSITSCLHDVVARHELGLVWARGCRELPGSGRRSLTFMIDSCMFVGCWSGTSRSVVLLLVARHELGLVWSRGRRERPLPCGALTFLALVLMGRGAIWASVGCGLGGLLDCWFKLVR